MYLSLVANQGGKVNTDTEFDSCDRVCRLFSTWVNIAKAFYVHNLLGFDRFAQV